MPSETTSVVTHKEIHTSMRDTLLLELRSTLNALAANQEPQQFFASGSSPSSSSILRPLRIPTVFFGGGTPSLAEVREYDSSESLEAHL